ncbi:MAG TPA: FecR domain-containing protein, partial [Anaerohalosphaeraceae bacterium]|nr:FecR domain-containing protein [Anaerohalosphaeraceae bacterium]
MRIFFELEALLRQDRSKRREYAESVLLYSMLHKSNLLFDKQFEGADLCNIKLWEILAEDEKNAPAVDIPKTEPSRQLIQKVEYKKAQRTSKKSSLLTVLVSAAAMLFFVFYAALSTPRQQHSPLGLITQVQDAVSAEHKKTLVTGAAVYPETLTLQKGSLKVELDSGVELVIASPSQIVFETQNSLLLNIGSLVASIPPQAVSFTVRTPLCSVVDYGTEFGISVDAAGQTQVEVFKGKVDLRDNPNPLVFGASRFVTAGQIGRFDLSGQITIQTAREVPAENKNTFVRRLPIEWTGKARQALWNDSANWDNGLPNLLHAVFLKEMKPGTVCQIDASHAGPARAQAHYINVGLRGYG